jgi:hypothetical protein
MCSPFYINIGNPPWKTLDPTNQDKKKEMICQRDEHQTKACPYFEGFDGEKISSRTPKLFRQGGEGFQQKYDKVMMISLMKTEVLKSYKS